MEPREGQGGRAVAGATAAAWRMVLGDELLATVPRLRGGDVRSLGDVWIFFRALFSSRSLGRRRSYGAVKFRQHSLVFAKCGLFFCAGWA